MLVKSCKIVNTKEKVQAGLSLSPSQIERMTQQGHAAALGSLDGNQYYDNLPAGADVPIEDRRGVDLNIIWRESKSAQKKINDARTQVAISERARTSTTLSD